MQDITGDLFASLNADAICITTNGYLAKTTNGVATTMGRGSAGEAKDRWPGIEYMLGCKIMEEGNRVHQLTDEIPEVYDGAVNPCGPILTLQTAPWSGREHVLPYHLISFPTKPQSILVDPDQSNVLPYLRKRWNFQPGQEAPGWGSPSLLQLIEQSARELVALADLHRMPNKASRWDSIVLPRPGCGAGELNWDEVRPILSAILDDRFYAITFR